MFPEQSLGVLACWLVHVGLRYVSDGLYFDEEGNSAG